MFLWESFDTMPIVAMDRSDTLYNLPLRGNRIIACARAFLIVLACVPAARTNRPPHPGFNSILWHAVPVGTKAKETAFPVPISMEFPAAQI